MIRCSICNRGKRGRGAAQIPAFEQHVCAPCAPRLVVVVLAALMVWLIPGQLVRDRAGRLLRVVTVEQLEPGAARACLVPGLPHRGRRRWLSVAGLWRRCRPVLGGGIEPERRSRAGGARPARRDPPAAPIQRPPRPAPARAPAGQLPLFAAPSAEGAST